MMPDITQQNLYLLIPAKVSLMVDMMVAEGGDIIEAIKNIYASDTYRNLSHESTKMWHLGPVTLTEELEREQYSKQLTQKDD